MFSIAAQVICVTDSEALAQEKVLTCLSSQTLLNSQLDFD